MGLSWLGSTHWEARGSLGEAKSKIQKEVATPDAVEREEEDPVPRIFLGKGILWLPFPPIPKLLTPSLIFTQDSTWLSFYPGTGVADGVRGQKLFFKRSSPIGIA